MQYVLPFFRIAACLGLTQAADGSQLTRPFDDLLDVIRHLIMPTPVDEDWYLTAYPDVRTAVSRSLMFSSASQHFAMAGYFEGRLPFERDAEQRRHPLAFAAVKAALTAVPARGRLMVGFTYAGLLELIRQLIVAIPVDSDWYLAAYPGVAASVAAGRFQSAAQHYVRSGYFENRLPYDMRVDQDWYIGAYADLKEAYSRDPKFSAAGHFERAGYREGRWPRRDALRWLAGPA